jgi:hypothetical protein
VTAGWDKIAKQAPSHRTEEEPMKSIANDSVIDEIRAIRHRISEWCNRDPAQIVAYYIELQTQHRDRLLGSQQPIKRSR